eukprot:2164753-Pyramimonas_sp.AAC.1
MSLRRSTRISWVSHGGRSPAGAAPQAPPKEPSWGKPPRSFQKSCCEPLWAVGPLSRVFSSPRP